MGIRQSMNEHPKPVIIGAVVVLIIAVGLIVRSLRGGNDLGLDESGPMARVFYTDDDGQSTFLDTYDKLGELDFKGPHGAEAVRAFQFRYSSQEPFVGYMVTYTPQGKQVMAEFYQNPANKGLPPPAICETQTLMKRPGQPKWLGHKDAGFFDVPVVPEQNGKAAAEVVAG